MSPCGTKGCGAECPKSHHCHAAGCRTVTAPWMLLCSAHLEMVDADKKRALYDAHRGGECHTCKGNAPNKRKYNKAAKAVLRQVNES